MSTTPPASAQAQTQRSYRLGIDPERAFDDLVFHDPTVCSRCFSLIRRFDTYRPDAAGGVSKYAPEERCIRAFFGTKGFADRHYHAEHDHFEYRYRPFKIPRTFCGACGSRSGRAANKPLSKRQAISFTDALGDRLDEADVAYKHSVLQYVVGALKEKRDCASYDTEIFRRATKLALTHARYDRE